MEIYDLKETLIDPKSKRKLTSFLFTQKAIRNFISQSYPSLNMIDVLKNKAFFHGLESSKIKIDISKWTYMISPILTKKRRGLTDVVPFLCQ